MNIDEILAGEGGLILDGNQANFLRGYVFRQREEEQRQQREKQLAYERITHQAKAAEAIQAFKRKLDRALY